MERDLYHIFEYGKTVPSNESDFSGVEVWIG
jgi:hypothetical protein